MKDSLIKIFEIGLKEAKGERGSLSESFITVVAIGLATVLMFIFPLMSLSDRTDDISQQATQTAVTEFVDNVRTTGKLTLSDYSAFEQRIYSTGNSFAIEMQADTLDENPAKKTAQASYTKIGENVYYTIYTSQILDAISKGDLLLKEGDMFSASVKNTNTTLSQQLKNFFYTVSGNDTYTIAAEHGGYVTANGSN